ncbi:LOW QUALITY PROTEIN: zinc finger protein Noc-like [Metopolophium dirhodum]|uniref:LOW QUALITY PROTEIN: zinc finger protein Noc-like n=1 Tax=Metopolophium dirhodum TaxID=44670 RepID=UPI002990521C|nr:LOW QUALITY PROTEIN: zinc finger protein Noc-like [Metopolophium dirhodum]
MAIMDSNPESNQYQYIQDTSLASLDSKTSPLAMLVRTCSQIGADPPMAAAAKSKKPAAAAPVSATAAAADRPHSASPAAAAVAYLGHGAAKHHRTNINNNYMEDTPKPAKLNFKPYENTVSTPTPHHHLQHAVQQHHHHSSPYGLHQLHSNHHNNNNNNDDDSRPKSSSSEDNGNSAGHGKKRKSASPRDEYSGVHHKSSRRSSSSASSSETAAAASTASSANDPSTNPIIRSGLEVMHGATAKAFCPPPPMPAHSPYKSHDPLAAFRHTYLPGAPWMPAAVSLAAAAAGKPSPSSDCKDPMCGGPASGCGQQQQHAAAAAALAFATQYHPMMAAAGACPAGCVQCDHQRYLSSLMAAASVPAFYAPVARPYTCSWVIPGGHMQSSSPTTAATESANAASLCGKSFSTSDELLQHIRTHTSAGGSAVSAAACMAAGAAGPMSPTTAAAFSAYNSHLSRHLFHHPSAAAAYGKPPSMMPPSPYSAFNPTAAYCYPPPSAAAAAAAAYHHHHHQQQQQQQLYSPRGDTSSATVSR